MSKIIPFTHKKSEEDSDLLAELHQMVNEQIAPLLQKLAQDKPPAGLYLSLHIAAKLDANYGIDYGGVRTSVSLNPSDLTEDAIRILSKSQLDLIQARYGRT